MSVPRCQLTITQTTPDVTRHLWGDSSVGDTWGWVQACSVLHHLPAHLVWQVPVGKPGVGFRPAVLSTTHHTWCDTYLWGDSCVGDTWGWVQACSLLHHPPHLVWHIPVGGQLCGGHLGLGSGLLHHPPHLQSSPPPTTPGVTDTCGGTAVWGTPGVGFRPAVFSTTHHTWCDTYLWGDSCVGDTWGWVQACSLLHHPPHLVWQTPVGGQLCGGYLGLGSGLQSSPPPTTPGVTHTCGGTAVWGIPGVGFRPAVFSTHHQPHTFRTTTSKSPTSVTWPIHNDLHLQVGLLTIPYNCKLAYSWSPTSASWPTHNTLQLQVGLLMITYICKLANSQWPNLQVGQLTMTESASWPTHNDRICKLANSQWPNLQVGLLTITHNCKLIRSQWPTTASWPTLNPPQLPAQSWLAHNPPLTTSQWLLHNH